MSIDLVLTIVILGVALWAIVYLRPRSHRHEWQQRWQLEPRTYEMGVEGGRAIAYWSCSTCEAKTYEDPGIDWT